MVQALGGSGRVQSGVLTVIVPRAENFVESGFTLPPSMMFSSMLNFQSIGNNRAAVVAEIPVLATEADTAAREILRQGLLVTALHNHEMTVQPRLYYVHAWGTGSPTQLATALRAVLNHTNSRFQS